MTEAVRDRDRLGTDGDEANRDGLGMTTREESTGQKDNTDATDQHHFRSISS